MSTKNDLQFLESLFNAFFKKSHIKRTLTTINASGITGWEKWLQVELATHLQTHSDVKSWAREIRMPLDKRKNDKRSTVLIDFHIHQKNKHSPLALELKHGKSMAGCVRGMLRDHQKVSKIRESRLITRSTWFLGIHPTEGRDQVLAEVDYYARTKHGFRLPEDQIATHQVAKTGYSFTIL